MTGVKSALKNGLKSILYHCGIASAMGRRITRNALTIVMFHRVLPSTDVRSETADPTYTLDLQVFEDFLIFLRRHYNPVSLVDVEDAFAGRKSLPAHAALVTFDDGWEDTAYYAAPVLEKQKVPSTVFVTSDVLKRDYTLWRDVAAILARAEPGGELKLEGLSEAQRNELLERALERTAHRVRPLMMTPGDLPKITEQGMAIGAHGVSHTPLTSCSNVEDELQNSKRTLESVTGKNVSGFAFPHGRYNPEVLRKTLEAGYRLVFTSDSVLNSLSEGRLISPVLGRVALSQDDLADDKGRFSPVRAAFFLMFREARILDRNSGSHGYN